MGVRVLNVGEELIGIEYDANNRICVVARYSLQFPVPSGRGGKGTVLRAERIE